MAQIRDVAARWTARNGSVRGNPKVMTAVMPCALAELSASCSSGVGAERTLSPTEARATDGAPE